LDPLTFLIWIICKIGIFLAYLPWY
jgi:hypothetical protein